MFHIKKRNLKRSFLYYEPCQSDKFQQMNFKSKFTCIGVKLSLQHELSGVTRA
jgi:hypothetical protein